MSLTAQLRGTRIAPSPPRKWRARGTRLASIQTPARMRAGAMNDSRVTISALMGALPLLVLALCACGTTASTCEQRCQGCCQGDVCVPGNTVLACGSAGRLCDTCVGSQTCFNGTCASRGHAPVSVRAFARATTSSNKAKPATPGRSVVAVSVLWACADRWRAPERTVATRRAKKVWAVSTRCASPPAPACSAASSASTVSVPPSSRWGRSVARAWSAAPTRGATGAMSAHLGCWRQLRRAVWSRAELQ